MDFGNDQRNQGELVGVQRPTEWGTPPFQIEWLLGPSCNFSCSYCGIKAKRPFVNHDSMLVGLKRLTDQLSPRRIRVTLLGGEPSLHPQLLPICQTLKEADAAVLIVTNGSRRPEFYLSLLPYLRYLTFSVHLSQPFPRTLESAIACAAAVREQDLTRSATQGCWVAAHVVMEAGYFDEARQAMEQLEKAGVAYSLRRVHPRFDPKGFPILNERIQGRPVIHRSSPDPEDIACAYGYYSREELEFLRSHESREPKYFYNVEEIWQGRDGAIRHQQSPYYSITNRELNRFKGWQCSAGVNTLYIDEDGTIYRASCLAGEALGNLHDQFTFPTNWVTCPKLECNGGDVNIAKAKSAEFASLLNDPLAAVAAPEPLSSVLTK